MTKKMTMLDQIKTTLKARFPRWVRWMKGVRQWGSEYFDTEVVFSKIHQSNSWDGTESVSGPGSTLDQTSILRAELPVLLRSLGAKSLIDAPCGDFHWMKETNLGIDTYIGIDIVRDLVESNQRLYGSENRQFLHRDIARDPLPSADLILCRDCLVHLSYKNVFSALRNFKSSGSKYLLTTTHSNTRQNVNIVTGGWRPLNLLIEPFNFPLPEKLIDEPPFDFGSTKSQKHIGLWKLSTLPI